MAVPDDGLYVTDFESTDMVYRFTRPGVAEQPVATNGNPGGLMRLGYQFDQHILYALNWGREGFSGPVNGVYRMAGDGSFELVRAAPAGTTFDELAVSQGGKFRAGPYIGSRSRNVVSRVPTDGAELVDRVTDVPHPSYLGFDPASGVMLLVYDDYTKIMWIGVD